MAARWSRASRPCCPRYSSRSAAAGPGPAARGDGRGAGGAATHAVDAGRINTIGVEGKVDAHAVGAQADYVAEDAVRVGRHLRAGAGRVPVDLDPERGGERPALRRDLSYQRAPGCGTWWNCRSRRAAGSRGYGPVISRRDGRGDLPAAAEQGNECRCEHGPRPYVDSAQYLSSSECPANGAVCQPDGWLACQPGGTDWQRCLTPPSSASAGPCGVLCQAGFPVTSSNTAM